MSAQSGSKTSTPVISLVSSTALASVGLTSVRAGKPPPTSLTSFWASSLSR